MPDIFNSSITFGDAFAMDETTLTFSGAPGEGGLGQLVQSLQATYARPVNRMFELGPENRTYYIVGRAQGTLGISKLAAPSPVNATFIQRFSDVCKVNENHITINSSPGYACNDKSTQKYTFRYCIITQLAMSINVNSISITENLNMMFAGLEQG